MKKRHFRLFRTAVTLVFALCLLAADLAPALAVTQADIDALKKDAASLDSKKKELESQLKRVSDKEKLVSVVISGNAYEGTVVEGGSGRWEAKNHYNVTIKQQNSEISVYNN